MKANPMPALVNHMARHVDGIDVASAGELRVALDAGANPLEISFAGPAKSAAGLYQSVASGILISAEAFREVELLADSSRTLALRARLAVRVHPDFASQTSGMQSRG